MPPQGGRPPGRAQCGTACSGTATSRPRAARGPGPGPRRGAGRHPAALPREMTSSMVLLARAGRPGPSLGEGTHNAIGSGGNVRPRGGDAVSTRLERCGVGGFITRGRVCGGPSVRSQGAISTKPRRGPQVWSPTPREPQPRGQSPHESQTVAWLSTAETLKEATPTLEENKQRQARAAGTP